MILITGGKGKFGTAFKSLSTGNVLTPGRKDMNMVSKESIDSYIERLFTSDINVDTVILNAYRSISQYIETYDYTKVDINFIQTQINESILNYNLNLYLVDRLLKKYDLKYVVFLTTGLSLFDTNHPEYRTLKVYGKDTLYRYFICKNKNTKVFSIHPGHMKTEAQYLLGAEFVKTLLSQGSNLTSYVTYLRTDKPDIVNWFSDKVYDKYETIDLSKLK